LPNNKQRRIRETGKKFSEFRAFLLCSSEQLAQPRQLKPPAFSTQSTTMFLNRVHRGLSSFKHVTHRWAAIPLRDPHHPITQTPSSHPADVIGKQGLSLTSWNIQASQSEPVARSKLILDHILKGPKSSDIIHLQEVASSV